MKTRILPRVVAAAVLAAAAEAQADGWYVFAGIGPSFTEDINGSVGGDRLLEESYDTGFMVSGGTGYQIGPYRVEGELTYAQYSIAQVAVGGIQGAAAGNRSTLAGLANFCVDFDTSTRWMPYAGAGIGAANTSLNNVLASTSALDDGDTVFAFQVKGGVAYSLSPSTKVSVGYRFLSADDTQLMDGNGLEVASEGPQSHTLEAGLRYQF